MMTHLIPEKRLDKNNRLITRHVTAQHTPAQATRTLPVPALPASLSESHREALAKDVKSVIHDIMATDDERFFEPVGKADVTVDNYSPQLLMRLAPILANNDDTARGVTEQIMGQISEKQLSKHLNAFDSLRHIEGMNFLRAADHALTLPDYAHPSVPISLVEDDYLKPEHIALMTVTHAVVEMLVETGDPRNEYYAEDGPIHYMYNTFNNAVSMLKDESLIGFVARTAHDADLVADIITRSGLTNAAEIEGIYDLLKQRPEDTDRINAILDSHVASRAVQVEDILGGTSIVLSEGTL